MNPDSPYKLDHEMPFNNKALGPFVIYIKVYTFQFNTTTNKLIAAPFDNSLFA